MEESKERVKDTEEKVTVAVDQRGGIRQMIEGSRHCLVDKYQTDN